MTSWMGAGEPPAKAGASPHPAWQPEQLFEYRMIPLNELLVEVFSLDNLAMMNYIFFPRIIIQILEVWEFLYQLQCIAVITICDKA